MAQFKKGEQERWTKTVTVDATTIITMLAGAVGVLWLAWSGYVLSQNRALKEDNNRLGSEVKKLTGMIVVASDNAESLQEMRKRLAEMLRGVE